MRIKLFIFLILFASQVFAQEGKLIFALDIVRHGDRTPLIDIPKAPHTWAEGMGQLTAQGMQQEYQVGVNLRKRYMQEENLLPAHYSGQVMYARSTDVDRTLMSAESILLGLYPLGSGPKLPESKKPALPGAYQPIPIHTVPRALDEEFIPDVDQKKMMQLLTKYVFPRNDWQEKDKELQPNYAHWSEVTGIPIKTLYDIGLLSDTLYINQIYNVPLPVGMTEEDAKKIIDSGKWAFATSFKPVEIGVATGSLLLEHITTYLSDASTQKSNLKFVLFTAHDTTILTLMSVLNAPLEQAPPYSSNVNFSLYEMNPGSYQVRVTYNGQPVTIPHCGGTVCTLEQFMTLSKQTPEVTRAFV